jgi:LPXTG-motif cell wall-anchored protein
LILIGVILAILGYVLWFLTVARYQLGELTHEAIEPFPTIGSWMSIIGIILIIIGIVLFVIKRKK